MEGRRAVGCLDDEGEGLCELVVELGDCGDAAGLRVDREVEPRGLLGANTVAQLPVQT